MKCIKLASIVVLIFLLISCKKESIIVETKVDKGKISAVKNWYNIHYKMKKLNIFNKEGDSTTIPTGMPEWDSTHSYIQSQSTSFIIPMRLESENEHANQFIIIEIDANGEIIKSEFAYLLLDSTATNNYTKQELENLTPQTFDFINIPTNLKAWVVKYDFDNNLIEAKYLANGSTINKELKFRGAVVNKAPIEQCENSQTIEWYWQIWINGELVYEEYLFSTTECLDGGGGGGGGGNGPNTECNMSATEGNAILDDSYVTTNLNNYIIPGIPMIEENNTTVHQPVTVKWPFATLHVAPNGSISQTITASYTGWRKRDSPIDFWRWEGSLSAPTFNSTTNGSGGNFCISITQTPATLGTIPVVGTIDAQAVVAYTFKLNVVCIGTLELNREFSGSITTDLNCN